MAKHFTIGRASALFLLLATSALRATDATWNYAVEIGATVQTSPAQITLTWVQDTNGAPASYVVYRKAPAATDWGNAVATLPGSVTSFTDSTVTTGAVYEYQIVKDFTTRGYRGYGYVQAGINAPLDDSRGTVILIVDNNFSASLAPELQRLQQDLAGDGWMVIRHDVGRGDSVTSVKNLIRADYNADPAHVQALFLFGHVPVPYSGLLDPDGHPGHLGAWPADVYYGEMDGQWTDSSVNAGPPASENSDPADVARLTNVPGDGKFDQTTIPGLVRLEIGRVDLSNLPGYQQYQSNASFPGELDLLRQYLNKDHNFRHGVLAVHRRALIGDYSGDKDGVAVAATGFRSFPPIVGGANVANLNLLHNDTPGVWLPTLQTDDYLFALGAGAGSYTTVSGIGTRGPFFDAASIDLVATDIHAVFVMLFGSWCGDWDNQDNILRSVLATPNYGLASFYVGVPHWFLHPMGLGETIGYCARLTQNNTDPGLYRHQVNQSANQVHIALMGDPTLRLNPVAPVAALSGVTNGGEVTLNWTAPSDPAIAGYHIYRAPSVAGPFTRLTNSPVAGTSFTDTNAPGGAIYQVRAIKLETTSSGTYFNASQGIFYPAGGASAPPSPPPPAPAPLPSHLVNLSVRSFCGTGSDALAVGFVIAGDANAGPMPLLIRATGPALREFGVDGVLADPVLTVYRDQAVVGSNDNWGTNAAQVSSVASAVGAFRLTDTASTDAALTASYGGAAYSAQVTGASGGTGVALAEVYDATPAGNFSATSPRLINLSARTFAGTGANVLTVGFVIAGTTAEKVLIRGVGPGLTRFGVAGALAHPQLKLLDTAGNVVATNAGWGGDPTLAAAFTQVGAFALDAGSADSALLASLPPGAYSAQITSTDGSTGIALAEVYEVK